MQDLLEQCERQYSPPVNRPDCLGRYEQRREWLNILKRKKLSF